MMHLFEHAIYVFYLLDLPRIRNEVGVILFVLPVSNFYPDWLEIPMIAIVGFG